MNSSTRTTTGFCLMLLAAVAAAGCAGRDPETEAPAVEEPAPSPALSAEALSRQAAQLDRDEAEVAARMQELDRGMLDLETREIESVRQAAKSHDLDEEALLPVEAMPAETFVAGGTSIEIEFMDALSSELSEIGNAVRATVAADAGGEDGRSIPAGTTLRGRVTDIRSERKIASSARLGIAFEEMDLPSGQLVPIESTLVLEGATQKRKDAAENRGDPDFIEPGQAALLQLTAAARWTAIPTPADPIAHSRF